MKDYLKKLRNTEREVFVFLAVILICVAGIASFMNFYFEAYQTPYLMREVFDLSENWQYQTELSDLTTLDSLKSGPELKCDETLTLFKKLDIQLPGAAILIRANHQTVNVYLDDVPLFLDRAYTPDQNPGMALHFVSLPEDYLNKTLKIEITSPYKLYAGRTSPILLGTIPSLEAYTLSQSMRPVIFMSMCLLLGMCTIALTFIQALKGSIHRQHLALGIFAVIWAFYYVCVEYIIFQFFAPVQVSVLSLGLYFSFPVPLTLFLYFSFERYKKLMLPAVILHISFVAVAFLLQAGGIVDLPRLVSVNNVFLAGLLYAVVLSVMEAINKNRLMILAAPFLTIAYVSMLYNFSVFYGRSGSVPYSYRDTYFLLTLVVLIYNVQQFFSQSFRRHQENELLSLQNRLAKESYENIKTHLRQVGGLKHEMRNQLTAIQTYLQYGRYEEAQSYVAQYSGQIDAVTDAVYHDSFLINAVVGKLLQTAEENGVIVELNLRAASVYVADPDLYSLLSNILENALEACAAVPAEQKRFINLTIFRREPYLNIICENSKIGEIISANGKIQTGKSESGHGYGLWTIERIVDAYDGIMDVSYDENTFTLMVALKDKPSKPA